MHLKSPIYTPKHTCSVKKKSISLPSCSRSALGRPTYNSRAPTSVYPRPHRLPCQSAPAHLHSTSRLRLTTPSLFLGSGQPARPGSTPAPRPPVTVTGPNSPTGQPLLGNPPPAIQLSPVRLRRAALATVSQPPGGENSIPLLSFAFSLVFSQISNPNFIIVIIKISIVLNYLDYSLRLTILISSCVLNCWIIFMKLYQIAKWIYRFAYEYFCLAYPIQKS